MSSKHGNSNDNDADHHLYEIRDKSEKNNVFKYGISGRPLNEDGTSPRAEEQIEEFNLIAGFFRFFYNILLIGIPGRKKAKEIEDEYIENYIKENGKWPKGNKKKNSEKR